MGSWSNWEALDRAEAERQREHASRQHYAVAQLLRARGFDKAAALVAIADFGADQVDNWDGGQYEAVFGVPPAQFDVVDNDLRVALTDAARDVIGDSHFAGVSVRVRLADAEPGWEEAMLREIFERRESNEDSKSLRELP